MLYLLPCSANFSVKLSIPIPRFDPPFRGLRWTNGVKWYPSKYRPHFRIGLLSIHTIAHLARFDHNKTQQNTDKELCWKLSNSPPPSKKKFHLGSVRLVSTYLGVEPEPHFLTFLRIRLPDVSEVSASRHLRHLRSSRQL